MAKSLALDVSDIRSVTDFQRNAKTHVARLKKTKAPMVLTVNGSAAVVMQDANAYQKLVERLQKLREELELNAAFEVGFEDVRQGKVKPARLALKYRGR
jgi:PHD/YefM family antitoxin component YafN of YafNO toxin-antitoxin module